MTDFLQFSCIEVRQSKRCVLYLGMLQFATLRRLCTVSPRTPRTDDPYFADTPNPSSTFPQRPEKPERLRKIAEFVRKRLQADANSRKEVVFPGTVILGLMLDIESHHTVPDNPAPTSAHLYSQDTRTMILLPDMASSLFIIDGQHRIKGLHALLDQLNTEIAEAKAGILSEKPDQERIRKLADLEGMKRSIEEFQVPITLLVDFDLEEQAMVFATVNFEQKPVQRSFYYDIFGAFESDKVTPLSFVHELVVHLQNSEKSPLHGMVKLLGTGPGLVSQAFLVARLVPLIDPQHPKSAFKTFFIRRQADDVAASRYFALCIRNFFFAVKEEFPYAWPELNVKREYSSHTYRYILCKSMVTAGMLGVLREIYKLSLLDFAQGKEEEVGATEVMSREFFRPFLANIDTGGRNNPLESVFSKQSGWAIGGSTKVERIIFDTLRHNLFVAYKQMALDTNSAYSQLATRHGGTLTAIALAKQFAEKHSLPESQRESAFWIETEELWEKTCR